MKELIVNQTDIVMDNLLDRGWFGWAEFLREIDEVGQTLGIVIEPDLAERPPEISDSVLDQDGPLMCLLLEGVSFENEKTG